MITWSDDLRYSSDIKGKVNRIKRRLRWRRATVAANFCVTFAVNESDLFDIYNMGELLFKYYQSSDTEIHIVGLASSRETACELAAEMVSEVYSETGDFNVRKYYGDNK